MPGMTFGGVELVLRSRSPDTADGRKLLVIHGDEFDGVVLYARWLAFLGDEAYRMDASREHRVQRGPQADEAAYWSLSAYLKKRVKNAVQFVTSFEEAVAHEASKSRV